MNWITNKRNKKWSKKLGWEPSDFGAEDFNRSLEIAITFFQKDVNESGHKIDVDGVCGPETFRFLDQKIVPIRDHHVKNRAAGNNGFSLLINGEWIDVNWPVVWHPLPSNCFKKIKKTRKPSVVVVHHDVCTSADQCHYVLKKAKNSTHIVIDNTGVLHQFVDLNDVAWHAGVSFYWKNKIRTRYSSKALNDNSIGVDFSNAWYVKYNDDYVKKGFKPREVLTESIIHGQKIGPHLDMYPAQVVAFQVLAKFLSKFYNIPLEVPIEDDRFVRGWIKECMEGKFKGFQVHFNSSINKIDTDLDLLEIINECRQG